MPHPFEVYAVRYATVERRRRENFIADDWHDRPMPMDYYVWVVRRPGSLWLVDAGFGAEAAQARRRQWLRCPIDALQALGIAAGDVHRVLLTHLHYDHAGNLGKLTAARFWLQEREMRHATGRPMTHGVLRHPYDVDDIVQAVRAVHDGRVEFLDGDHELEDGLQALHVGGHTDGLQALRVHTARGWVVLASDAAHYHANLLRGSPFPIVFHVGDMLAGHRRLLAACEGPDHLIPGHDPLVRLRFPPWGDGMHDIVCLHQPPLMPLPPASEL